jgi:protein MAK11
VQAQKTIDVFSTVSHSRLPQFNVHFDPQDMVLRHTITHPSRVHTVQFSRRVNGSGDLLLVGAEDKKLSIYDIPDDLDKMPTIIAEMTGHSNRYVYHSHLQSLFLRCLSSVKAVEILRVALPHSTKENAALSTIIVCTVSSDGKIHIYDLASLPADLVAGSEALQVSPVAEYDTKGTRLTCVTIAEGETPGHDSRMSGKRKREDEDSDQEDEDEAWGPPETKSRA